MLRGRFRGETCAVQAGRERVVSPTRADREANARRGGNTSAKGTAPVQSRKAGSGVTGTKALERTLVKELCKLTP